MTRGSLYNLVTEQAGVDEVVGHPATDQGVDDIRCTRGNAVCARGLMLSPECTLWE